MPTHEAAATGYVAPRTHAFTNRDRAPLRAARLRASNRAVFVVGSGLFLLPNALFALQLRWMPATILLAGALVSAALLAMRPAGSPEALLDRGIDRGRLTVCALVALVLLLLGGEAHVFYANWDWLWRDAVLADLARTPFPPTYAVDGADFVLRAPLGMYMLPALVAKAAGLGAGHGALLLQNTALLTCVLYFLALLAGRGASVCVAIFLSFSGLDIVGQLFHYWQGGTSAAAFLPPAHIETWTIFQYSSTLTQLFWVPNHALPSYWMALVALLCVVGDLTIADFGLALAAALFWSPFAFIGGMPFAALIFLRSARVSLRSPRFWIAVAAALCFLPVAFYMKADAAQVPHGLLPLGLLLVVLQFLVLEIPHVFVVREAWRDLDGRIKGLVLVAIVMLVGLPLMRLGAANDLVMRASIPALTILAFAFAQALLTAWPRRRGLCVVAFAIIVVGAVTPAMEVARALVVPRFAISDCGFVSAWKTLLPEAEVSNYLARAGAMPGWLVPPTPAMTEHARACWPDLGPHEFLRPRLRGRAIGLVSREPSAGSTLPQRDDEAARDDQGATDKDRERRRRAEGHEVDDLPDHEERRDIGADEAAPVQRRQVEGQAVAIQDDASCQHEAGPDRHGVRLQADPDDRVAAGLKRRGEDQEAERKKGLHSSA